MPLLATRLSPEYVALVKRSCVTTAYTHHKNSLLMLIVMDYAHAILSKLHLDYRSPLTAQDKRLEAVADH